MVQFLIVAASILGAAAYVAVRFARTIRAARAANDGGGCGSACGCSDS